VSKSLPANVIAAGNPAVVIKQLDPDMALIRRADLLADHEKLSQDVAELDQALRKDNSWLKWLRSLIAPGSED
jgi:hypothetical protein